MSYRCQGDTAKFPEGGVIICGSGKAVQSPKSKCRVECDVGSPNYAEIECKQIHGWRPTSKLECTGVAPGVVVGVLLGGIICVVLIAYLLAKYKQSKKKKELKKNPPPPKSGRRPGMGRPGVGAKPAAAPQPNIYPSAPSVQAIPVDYESQKTYNSEGSLKHQSARNKARRPPTTTAAPAANKPRRNTTNRPKPRIAEPGMDEEDWHFRNQGYEYNEMMAPQEGYPIQARYSAHPEPSYNYESFHEAPPPPQQIGFQGGYGGPPPRPSRTSGVYSVEDQYQ